MEGAMTRFFLVFGAMLLATEAALAASCDITSRICTLRLPFDPSVTTDSSSYTPPTCSSKPPPSKVIQDIQSAFNSASPNLQNDLCSLTWIFFHKAQVRHSWGKWESKLSSPKAYIALHALAVEKPMTEKQDDNLNVLTFGLGSHSDNSGKLVIDSQKVSLLYTLAHEMGHIKWRRDRSTSAAAGCNMDTFINYSWDTTFDQTRLWTDENHEFGSYNDGNVKPASQVTDAAGLQYIYQHGFATGFGANNPEEDFVETYAMGAILKAYPSYRLSITIGANTYLVNDASGTSRDGGLVNKFNCVLKIL
jgi:hypothetical protein